jgi:hypothetical protein
MPFTKKKPKKKPPRKIKAIAVRIRKRKEQSKYDRQAMDLTICQHISCTSLWLVGPSSPERAQLNMKGGEFFSTVLNIVAIYIVCSTYPAWVTDNKCGIS